MSTNQYGFPGQQALGELVRRCRRSAEVRNQFVNWSTENGSKEPIDRRISQEQFARWVSEVSGIAVSESAIGRLERGEGRSGPPINVLIALCKMEVLRVEGEVCDLNWVGNVLCREI